MDTLLPSGMYADSARDQLEVGYQETKASIAAAHIQAHENATDTIRLLAPFHGALPFASSMLSLTYASHCHSIGPHCWKHAKEASLQVYCLCRCQIMDPCNASRKILSTTSNPGILERRQGYQYVKMVVTNT